MKRIKMWYRSLRTVLFLWRHWKELKPEVREAIFMEMVRLLAKERMAEIAEKEGKT